MNDNTKETVRCLIIFGLLGLVWWKAPLWVAAVVMLAFMGEILD